MKRRWIIETPADNLLKKYQEVNKAGRRLSMRKIKEVLRLKWYHGHSNKQIALSCKIARSTVRDYLHRAEKAGITWPLDTALDDRALEALLFPLKPPSEPMSGLGR